MLIVSDIWIKVLSKINNEKHFKELLLGSAMSFLAKITGIMLGFVLTFVIARFYGSEELGNYSIVLSVMSVAFIMGTLGTNTSVLRLLPEQIAKHSYCSAYRLYWKLFYIVLSSSLVVSLVIYVFSERISNNLFHKPYLSDLLQAVAPVVIFASIGTLSVASIRALKNIKLFSILQTILPVIQLVFLLFLTLLFFQKYNSVYTWIIANLLWGTMAFYLLIKLFKASVNNKMDNVSVPKTTNLLKISIPMMLTTVMSMIVTQTDIFMLGSMSTAKNVGIYSTAMKLSMLSTFILTSVNVILAPKISELYYSNKNDELKILMNKTVKLISLSSLPIFLVLIFFGEYLFSLFGKEFVTGYTAMILLLTAQAISVLSGPTEFFLNMTGYQNQLNYIIIVAAIVNILLNYLLIPRYGMNGAAFASMISLISLKIINTLYIRYKFGFFISYIPFYRSSIV